MTDSTLPVQSPEERLTEFIDIPYFRNNPSYIELWRKYYSDSRDPKILLLMYHKKIGTYYHWLYIELAKHFIRIGRAEIAHFVLTEAVRENVYSQERLREALAKVPPFTKQYFKSDMRSLLDQKNIHALGRIWNSYTEVFFYEQHLSSGSSNFTMMKVEQYQRLYGGRWSTGSQPIMNTDDWTASLIDDPMIIKVYECIGSSYGPENILNFTSNSRDKCEVFPSELTKEATANPDAPSNLPSSTSDITSLSANCTTQESTRHIHHAQYMVPPSGNADNAESADALVADVESTQVQTGELQNVNSLLHDIDSVEESSIIASSSPSPDQKESPTVTSDSSVQGDTSVPADSLDIHRIPGSITSGSELLIGEYIHIVQEVEGETGLYTTMRIGKDADITETMSGKNYCMVEIHKVDALAISHVVGSEFCSCDSDNRLFRMFECDKLCTLEEVLVYCDGEVALFYAQQLLEFVARCMDRGFLPVVVTFWIDLKFKAIPIRVQTERHSPEAVSKLRMLLENTFRRFDLAFGVDFRADYHKLDRTVSGSEFKGKLLKHKSKVLNAL